MTKMKSEVSFARNFYREIMNHQ